MWTEIPCRPMASRGILFFTRIKRHTHPIEETTCNYHQPAMASAGCTRIDQPLARFEGEGDNKLDKPRYDAVNRRVFINAGRYFEGVAPEVLEYRIGGYQVCEKWLKDRKGRRLSLDDIKHYCRVVTALAGTIDMQREIDGLYSGVEKKTI